MPGRTGAILLMLSWFSVWATGCNGGGGGTTSPAVTGAQVVLETLWAGALNRGETIQFRIVAKDLPGVFQSSFRILYDNTKLRYSNFQPGSFWIRNNDTISCRQLLSQVRDFPGSGTVLVVVSRPGAGCGNTDKVNGEMGRLTMAAISAISSPTGLARFTTDESRLLVRNAAGTYLTLRQRTDSQLSFTPAAP
ncbi:MAG: hypothetical protein V2G42_06285 [bacterium JZ-2024 1]